MPRYAQDLPAVTPTICKPEPLKPKMPGGRCAPHRLADMPLEFKCVRNCGGIRVWREQDLQKPDARHCKKFEGFMFVFCRGCGEVLHLPANFLEHFHVDDAIVPCVLHPCKPFAR